MATATFRKETAGMHAMDLEVREGFPKQSMEMSGPLPKLGWGGGGGSTLHFVDELLKIC